jgi:hypothetical protein
MFLPIEIVNKIFMYVSSPTARLIKESQYYRTIFPFFYLKRVHYQKEIDLYFQNNDEWTEIGRFWFMNHRQYMI